MRIISWLRRRTILGFFSAVMTIVLVVAIFSVLYSILALLILPDANEYEGKFPSDPPIFSEKFWSNLTHGILRHWALLRSHIGAGAVIRIVGLAFATNLIYNVRAKVSEMREMEKEGKKGSIKIHEYVEWGFGSIITAIISAAANIISRPDLSFIILILSISALMVYSIHPKDGVLPMIRKWIEKKGTT